MTPCKVWKKRMRKKDTGRGRQRCGAQQELQGDREVREGRISSIFFNKIFYDATVVFFVILVYWVIVYIIFKA